MADLKTTSSASASPPGPALSVTDLSQSFGGNQVLHDVSFHVDPGELVATIGPNGAGKTTLFNCITGVYRPQSGSIRLGELELVGRRPSAIVRLGVARTFQNLALFGPMTVAENLLVGRHHAMRSGILSVALRPRRSRREEAASRRTVDEILEMFSLTDIATQPVASVPHGVGKRIELARAFAMEPGVLLLDEPAAGLNPEETETFAEYLTQMRRLRPEMAVVLIEHDMPFVLSVAQRVVVLNFGREVTTGAPEEIREDPRVIEAYLGRKQ